MPVVVYLKYAQADLHKTFLDCFSKFSFFFNVFAKSVIKLICTREVVQNASAQIFDVKRKLQKI
jgi:hypothetical protein